MGYFVGEYKCLLMEESESLKYQIGNWVRLDIHQNSKQIIEFKISEISGKTFRVVTEQPMELTGEMGKQHKINYLNVAGIPLTEDILLNIDFEPVKDIPSCYLYSGKAFVHLYKDPPGQYLMVESIDGKPLCLNVRYLHQLQNCLKNEFNLEVEYTPIPAY